MSEACRINSMTSACWFLWQQQQNSTEALSQYRYSALLLRIRLIRRTAEVDDCSYGKQCFPNMTQTLGR